MNSHINVIESCGPTGACAHVSASCVCDDFVAPDVLSGFGVPLSTVDLRPVCLSLSTPLDLLELSPRMTHRIKHGRRGAPHMRTISTIGASDLKTAVLSWGTGSMQLAHVKRVAPGKTTAVFEGVKVSDAVCFSLLSDDRTLDLEWYERGESWAGWLSVCCHYVACVCVWKLVYICHVPMHLTLCSRSFSHVSRSQSASQRDDWVTNLRLLLLRLQRNARPTVVIPNTTA